MGDKEFIQEIDMANPGNIFSMAVHSIAMTIDTRIAATLTAGWGIFPFSSPPSANSGWVLTLNLIDQWIAQLQVQLSERG